MSLPIYNESVFGPGGGGGGGLDAQMLNRTAESGVDWNTVLANGIRGAANAAISASVGEKFRDGQLQTLGPASVGQAVGDFWIKAAFVAGALYFFLGRK